LVQSVAIFSINVIFVLVNFYRFLSNILVGWLVY